MFKKIIKSFLNLFLFSATIHNCILVILAIKNSNIKYLNYFRILSLDEFWPEIATDNLSDLLSLLLIIVMVIVFYIIENIKTKLKKN